MKVTFSEGSYRREYTLQLDGKTFTVNEYSGNINKPVNTYDVQLSVMFDELIADVGSVVKLHKESRGNRTI